MSIELKRQYNELLKREKKAEAYLDSPDRTPEEIARWTPEFQHVLKELNDLLQRIGTCTAKEVCYGFEEGGETLGQQAELWHGISRQNETRG